MTGIDVPAVRAGAVTCSFSRDLHIIFFEYGQGHVTGARRSLTIPAVTLRHDDGVAAYGVADVATQTLPRDLVFFVHWRFPYNWIDPGIMGGPANPLKRDLKPALVFG